MTLIKTPPLSVNKCWQGRRFKTEEYDDYEMELLLRLPKMKIKDEPMKLKIVFGFSNKASDIDNPVKPLMDILQKKYHFNDKNIYKLEVEKVIVKKGSEYLDFEITKI